MPVTGMPITGMPVLGHRGADHHKRDAAGAIPEIGFRRRMSFTGLVQAPAGWTSFLAVLDRADFGHVTSATCAYDSTST
jgi:hypothetical protein